MFSHWGFVTISSHFFVSFVSFSISIVVCSLGFISIFWLGCPHCIWGVLCGFVSLIVIYSSVLIIFSPCSFSLFGVTFSEECTTFTFLSGFTEFFLSFLFSSFIAFLFCFVCFLLSGLSSLLVIGVSCSILSSLFICRGSVVVVLLICCWCNVDVLLMCCWCVVYVVLMYVSLERRGEGRARPWAGYHPCGCVSPRGGGSPAPGGEGGLRNFG